MKTLEQQLEDLQELLSQRREHPITQDEFALWKNSTVTKVFYLEWQEQYLENHIDEPVVVAHAQRVSDTSTMYHTNPVEETAINSALKSGRGQVLDEVLSWEPANLDREDKDDE